jgi:hypothetical protein
MYHCRATSTVIPSCSLWIDMGSCSRSCSVHERASKSPTDYSLRFLWLAHHHTLQKCLCCYPGKNEEQKNLHPKSSKFWIKPYAYFIYEWINVTVSARHRKGNKQKPYHDWATAHIQQGLQKNGTEPSEFFQHLDALGSDWWWPAEDKHCCF